MNVVYRVEWTEHESGMGQRPDGVTYATDKALLDKEIKRIVSHGDYLCYSRAGDIGMCIVTDDLLKRIGTGVYTTIKYDDPGMLGFFRPKDPKANIETFRQRASPSAPA